MKFIVMEKGEGTVKDGAVTVLGSGGGRGRRGGGEGGGEGRGRRGGLGRHSTTAITHLHRGGEGRGGEGEHTSAPYKQ